MTMHPEMRFVCDVCRVMDVLPLANVVPRNAPPEGWLILRVGDEIVNLPVRHLCPTCKVEFDSFMSPEGI
jgi:hypothetical protein